MNLTLENTMITENKNSCKHEFKSQFMKRAIELSRHASLIEKSGGVFGAVIVKDDEIIAEGYNQVVKNNDPTWHAEMHAIREACKKLNSPHIPGCVLYTSSEPCPMCFSGCQWAHIDKIFYGATTKDALQYGNFADCDILGELRKEPQNRIIQSTELMRDEAVIVWKEYSVMKDRVPY
ncbi:MAG: nucleoside deaminase [Edafosvirus sp.]|uniref:Nucleoside deaminase n=1 Tax=Edafosvirus sp. TaxID=2487765 RepID=A0A3G4ZWR9_9VIRU|nr:MAG: nucleoside deaminase [Edafosvirus sp.]